MSNADTRDTTPETQPPAPAPAEATAPATPVEIVEPAGATGAAADAGSPAADLAQLETELAAARKEAAENYERYLRAIADHENYRKRTLREKDEIRQFAATRVLEDLMPVLDTLGLARAAVEAPGADVKALAGGVTMVIDQLRSVLDQHGLKSIDPKGQPFDPNLHEAISQQPSADVPEGNVIQVVRAGYQLNGRLLRAASVVVSGGPERG